MNKKYLFLLIIIIGIIISPFFLKYDTSQVVNKHYKNEEVSLDYPADWQELKTGNTQIAVFKDPKTGYNITVNRQMIPTTNNTEGISLSHSIYKPNINYIITPPNGVKNDFIPVSTEYGNISNVPYTLNTYQTKINSKSVIIKELWLQKNNAIYSVIYKSNLENSSIPIFGYSYNPNEFDVIKNSLKVDNANLKKSAIFASISIPRLGVKWNIHTDTVNVYNGVYHYDESFYPGQNGSIGFLGHHTTFSAPFNHIETLQKGDKIYIDDYLTQKRYVYEVINTSDIRYDYSTNKIKFYPNNRELILATCWPPGSTAAEIYIHCQLDSVEPL